MFCLSTNITATFKDPTSRKTKKKRRVKGISHIQGWICPASIERWKSLLCFKVGYKMILQTNSLDSRFIAQCFFYVPSWCSGTRANHLSIVKILLILVITGASILSFSFHGNGNSWGGSTSEKPFPMNNSSSTPVTTKLGAFCFRNTAQPLIWWLSE